VCQPQFAIRARRGRVCLIAAICAFAFVCLLYTGPWGMNLVSPGQLSVGHLAIKPAGGSVSNCAACHAAATPTRSVLASTFAAGHGQDQSKLCMTCHFTKTPGAERFAGSVHSLDPGRLARSTHEAAERSASTTRDGDAPGSATGYATGKLALASFVGMSSSAAEGEMACAKCHREHRGRDHDLAHMDDARCQSCHQAQFKSFNHGHPEFQAVQRTQGGIKFNHVSHKEAHFGKTAFDCNRCHEHDVAGKTMLLKSHALSCAGCHNQGSKDHHGDQIKRTMMDILQLPELVEDDAYEEDAAPFWPLGADDDIEGITPVMQLLLAGDEDKDALLALHDFIMEADGDTTEWEPDEDEAKEHLAAAIKRLVGELFNGDGSTLQERLGRSLGTTAQDPTVMALTEQVQSGAFAYMAYKLHWWPSFPEVPTGEQEDESEASEPYEADAGWTVDENKVGHRPVGHADPLLKIWIEALVARGHETSNGQDVEAAESEGSDDAEDDESAEGIRRSLRSWMFTELTDPNGALRVQCLRCHNVDRHAGGSRVNWLAAGRETGATGYAKYSHRPHITMLNTMERSCQHCHVIEKPTDLPEGALDRGVLAHKIEQCTSCHAPRRADNSCLTCHNYHINRP
jgi:hypothetical protein